MMNIMGGKETEEDTATRLRRANVSGKKKPSSCVVARRRVIIKQAKKGELFIWLEFKQVRKKGPPVNPSTFMGTKPAAADCQLRHWQTESSFVCVYDLSFPSDAVAFFYSELMYYS